MKCVFITGLEGFVGGHLGEYLVNKGYSVGGTIIGPENDFIKQNKKDLYLCECDICDRDKVQKVISEFKPDYLVHLAAISYVPFSWKDPGTTYKINLNGTISVLESLKNQSPKTKMIFISSCNVYGKGDGKYPITEKTPYDPDNFYGLSKRMGEELCDFYIRKFGLKIIIIRPFNHIGPGQSADFAISSFAKQIAMIEKKLQPNEIKVGDLSPSRDFTDVRDIINGYRMLAESELDSGIFNICSGIPVKIEDALKALLKLSKEKIKVVQDKEKMRPSDIQVYYGSYKKLQKAIGWKPEIPFEKTLVDILNYWRERV
ncbi:MAG: GDP-mannose 4,6-dehydratase [bacterium]|nr:GDP-mannose 4,6-dehydratase [bacterium]